MSQMLEEIRQQPGALERTLKGELRTVEKLKRALTARRPRMILLAARGTSDNAAQFGRYLLEITTGIPVSLAAPSIFTLYQASLELKDVLVVAISQSGESTDANLVLERAKEAGAMTVGITNETESTLAQLAEWVLLVRAGREKSVAATKTYTGQMLMMYLLAYALGAAIEIDDLRCISDNIQMTLAMENDIQSRSERYTFMRNAVVVGRGLNYSNAFEFALKMMETCYVVAERFSSADFLHGPIAMVESGFPAFLFAPSGMTWQGSREMLEKLTSLKAETLVITDLSNKEAIQMAPRSMTVPVKLAKKRTTLPEEVYTPIPYIVPAQMFAACLAEQKGLDPDRPRTLSKVTQTL
jgi:glucosamine--fructose-6-phosphate aminotransferase (isomerizing)